MKQAEKLPSVNILPSIANTALKMGLDEGGRFLYAVTNYLLNGITPELEGTPGLIWGAIFPNLETTRKISLGRSKGGKATKRNNPNGRRGKATAADPGASDGSQMEIHDSRKHQSKIPPNIDALRGYIEVNNLNVDAEEFYNYYSSQNWEIDGKPIRSLAALLKRWSERANGKPSAESLAQFIPNERGEVNVCGILVKLGYGERINSNGLRTYGNGQTIVPQDAPRRPADGYDWSNTLNEWVYNSF